MKSIIKWIYVVILPTGVTLGAINYFYNEYGNYHWFPFTLVLVALLLVWFNSLFFTIHMNKTSLLPKITVNTTSFVGVGLGIDNRANDFSWIILFPFLTIEFKSR